VIVDGDVEIAHGSAVLTSMPMIATDGEFQAFFVLYPLPCCELEVMQ